MFFFFPASSTRCTIQLSLVITIKLQLAPHRRYLCVLSPQVGGCANRVHEEQGVGQVFPRAPRISEALIASGLLPAQASAKDPQVPPTVARASVCLQLLIQTIRCYA